MQNAIAKRLTRASARWLKTVAVQNALVEAGQKVVDDAVATTSLQDAMVGIGQRAIREALTSPTVEAVLIRIGLRIVRKALDSPELQRKLWLATNLRPSDEGADYGALRLGDVERARYELATRNSAEFALEHLSKAGAFWTPVDLLHHCVEVAKNKAGIFAEFGVYRGGTINIISALVPERTVDGFDSFQGLPEDWRDCWKGSFTTGGELPQVNANVALHAGLFGQTLPSFLEQRREPAAFLHIDCDLYSSAKCVFDHMKPRIEPGTVILFDEFFNYPNYEEHEYKAWFEFVEQTKCRYRFLGYAARSCAVGLQIEAMG
jgi:hypothetical protein